MPSLKFDMNDVKPLLGSLGLGQPPDATLPDTSKIAPPPPPTPAPTPAAAGFSEWKTDPANQQKVISGITPPNTPIIPDSAKMAFLNPPQKQFASSNPPNMPAAPVEPIAPPASTALLPYQPTKGTAPTTINTPGTMTQDEYFTANPDQRARKQFSGGGTVQNILNGIAAGTLGAAGGLKGNPSAGAEYVAQGAARDANVPEVNNSRYRAAVIQPQIDARSAAQAGANLEHTQAQTSDIAAKHQSQLAQHGLMEVADPTTGTTSVVSDPDSPVTKANASKDAKVQAATEYLGAQTDSSKAQKELRDAQTAYTNNKSDPNSLVSKQIAARLATAQQNAHTSAGKLSQSELTYRARYLGTGADGQALPGTMITDEGTPVGSAFSGNVRPTGTERNKGDMAASAADQINDMKAIIKRNPAMFGPGYGQSTEFKRWVGGQSPDAQRFIAARTIAGDHLAGTFGGRSEAALQALDNAAGQFKDNPEAALAGLDQLAGANSRFQTAGTVRTAGSNAGKGITPAPTSGAPKAYKQTATGADGHKIGSNDGTKWFDVKTGKAIQ